MSGRNYMNVERAGLQWYCEKAEPGTPEREFLSTGL